MGTGTGVRLDAVPAVVIDLHRQRFAADYYQADALRVWRPEPEPGTRVIE